MGVGIIVLIAILAVVVLVTLVKSVTTIHQAEKGIVERFGRYKETLEPGLRFLVPFMDSLRARIDMRETVIDIEPQPVITKDNVTVTVDAVVYYYVTEAKAVRYEVANFYAAVTKLAQTNLRNVIGDMSLDETLTSRERINAALRETLDEATDKWGVKVTRVEVKEIEPPKDISEAMSKQMKAEREKRATILEAEAYRQKQILEAEGDKQNAILVAEGETVPVQSTVGFVGEVGEDLPEVTPPPSPVQKSGPHKTSADIQAQVAGAGSALPVTPHAAAPVPERSARFSISPRARKLAKDAVIDPQYITGTGPDGRIVEKDVEVYLDARGYHELRITPAAKSLAAKESLDVLAIEGTADGNKIVVADVERAVAEKPKPMSKMRQIIAERLTRSVTTAPHFFVTVPVDMTGLIELRAELKTKNLAFSMTDYAIM